MFRVLLGKLSIERHCLGLSIRNHGDGVNPRILAVGERRTFWVIGDGLIEDGNRFGRFFQPQ